MKHFSISGACCVAPRRSYKIRYKVAKLTTCAQTFDSLTDPSHCISPLYKKRCQVPFFASRVSDRVGVATDCVPLAAPVLLARLAAFYTELHNTHLPFSNSTNKHQRNLLWDG